MMLNDAAKIGDRAAVEAMLAEGTDPDLVDETGTTPLHDAAAAGHVGVVGLLVAANANPNAADPNGVTPLHSAACFGYPEMADLLLRAGANANALDNNGCSCLDAALIGLQVFLDDDPEDDIRKRALTEFTETFSLLARHGAQSVKMSERWKLTIGAIIHSVVARDDTELASILVSQSPEALREVEEESGLSPLHVATLCPDTKMMEVLLSGGADPNWGADGVTPLHWVAMMGKGDTAAVLIAHGADPQAKDKDGLTPLHQAARDGNVEVARALLEAGVPVDILSGDEVRGTPLLHATIGEDTTKAAAMVSLLLDSGADPLCPASGTNPLYPAIESRRETIKPLLEHCRDINGIAGGGGTPLYFAAYLGDVESVRDILSRGADPNRPNPDGTTPIRVALAKGDTATVDLLRQHGATMPPSGAPRQQKSGGCYIATACYGSYDHPDVMVLRRFRDDKLMASALGRTIVGAYYTISPSLACGLGRCGWLGRIVRRCCLEPIVRHLS